MRRFFATGLIVTGLLLGSLSAQSQAPSQPPRPSTPPPGQPPTRQQPQPGEPNRQPDERMPVYITGVVALEDGTPVPLGVRVELIFGGRVARQETTRSDGSFVFDLSSRNQGGFTDASVSSADEDLLGRMTGMGGGGASARSPRTMERVDLAGWEVRATLAGYVSDTVMLHSRSSLENPDIGKVVLHPLAQVKASTISLNGLKAPKKALRSFENAEKAMQKKTPDRQKALSELEKAVAEYPEYSSAWQLMGEIRMLEKDTAGARTAFEKARATDDKYVSPYLSLAALDLQEHRWAEAADLTNQLVALNPYVTRGLFFNAVANFNLGHDDLAEQAIREVQKQDERNSYPLAHYILGGIFANRGNLNKAVAEFQAFLKEQPNSPYADRVRQSLAVWGQQGAVAAVEDPAPPQPKKR